MNLQISAPQNQNEPKQFMDFNFEKVDSTQKIPIQKNSMTNLSEEEPQMKKIQENITVVKNNKEVNPNPGLFGPPPGQISQVQNNFNSNNSITGIKTPQIFTENKTTTVSTEPKNNKISKTDQFIDKTTDKAFDALWENDKFQKGMKDGAKNLAYNAVASKVPMKQEPGVQHPLGNLAAKATEKALDNDVVQKNLKDAAKNATSNAIKKEVSNPKPVEKKKGLFFF